MIGSPNSFAMLTPGTGVGSGRAVPGSAQTMSTGQETDFGSVVKSMLRDAAATIQTGEATAIAGMQGKVPLQQVVETVVQAEQTMHTAVAIRDKVVSAYLEISRMQI
jgi:flagellar hook-basal body complex protein FliE